MLTTKHGCLLVCILSLGAAQPAARAQAPVSAIQLKSDKPVTLRFYGANDADLFRAK